METRDLLLEIGTEEIPARMVENGARNLQRFVTKAMEDGKDELADAKVRDKETEFVSELSSNPNDKTDDSKPRQRLATVTFPFSNVGVMVGVRIRL